MGLNSVRVSRSNGVADCRMRVQTYFGVTLVQVKRMMTYIRTGSTRYMVFQTCVADKTWYDYRGTMKKPGSFSR